MVVSALPALDCCPSVLLDRVRGRAGAAVSWSPHESLDVEGAAARRAAFALHVGLPTFLCNGLVGSRRERRECSVY